LTLRLAGLEPEDGRPALRRRELDIAVVHHYDLLPLPGVDPAERHDLCTDPVVVVLPEDDPAAAGGPVDLADLGTRRWLSVDPGTSCHRMLQRACGAAGFVPDVIAHAAEYGPVLALVAAGAGVTLLPRLGVGAVRGVGGRRPPTPSQMAPEPSGVPAGAVVRPLARPIERHVFALTNRAGERHPAVAAVLDHLRKAAAGAG